MVNTFEIGKWYTDDRGRGWKILGKTARILGDGDVREIYLARNALWMRAVFAERHSEDSGVCFVNGRNGLELIPIEVRHL